MSRLNLTSVEFTEFGSVKLSASEVVQCTVDSAEFQAEYPIGPVNQTVNDCSDARCMVTSSRLIWLENGSTGRNSRRSCSIPLTAVKSIAVSSGILTMMNLQPKVKLQIAVDSQNYPTSGKLYRSEKLYIKSKDGSGLNVLLENIGNVIKRFEDLGPPQAQYGTPSGGLPAYAAPEVDQQSLETLCVMGFSRSRCHLALAETGNSMNAALQWISDNKHRSDAELQACATIDSRATQSQGRESLIQGVQNMGYFKQDAERALASSVSSHPTIESLVNWIITNPGAQTKNPNPVYPVSGYPAPAYCPPPPQAIQSHALSHVDFSASTSMHGSDASTSAGTSVQQFSNPYGAARDDQQQVWKGGGATMPIRRPGGLAGIVSAEKTKNKEQETTVHRAFQDLAALMTSGAKMVALAQELRARAAAQAQKPTGEAGTAEGGLDATMEQDLVDLGIYSPVTKDSAGKRFHEDLARQLADFLSAKLRNAGGMMALHDVYCLFNRARGTELVSPDDLRIAADQFEKLGLHLMLRTFPSGATVIQDESCSDDAVCEKMVDLLSRGLDEAENVYLGRGVTATKAATELQLPMAVATEQLLLAERHGILCRDDGPEGLIFYRNFFRELVV